MTIIASSPGSMMLMGEHAVLHGYSALVAAVTARVVVTLTPRNDRQVHIDCVYGQLQTTLDHLKAEAPFDLVMIIIASFADDLNYGCTISIDSSAMPTAMGIGSSTALAVALTAAMQQWLYQTTDKQRCFDRALQAVRVYQGSCSGADVAASVYGGVLAYANAAVNIEPLSWLPDVVVLYSGFKMKTADVIQAVQQRFADNMAELKDIYRRIGACVQQAIACQHDAEAMLQAVASNQALMQQMGLVDARLQAVLDFLQQQPGIRGAKVSGAGLGDCVIGFGQLQGDAPFERVPLQLSHKGVKVEHG